MSGRTPKPSRSSRAGKLYSGAVVAAGLTLLVGSFVLIAVGYRPYAVPTQSMEPTVAAGEKVLAERISGDEVRRGDIVVFRDAEWGDTPMVKRVIGVGGDLVACCDARGRLTINGTAVAEPYLASAGAPDIGGSAAGASPVGFSARVARGRLFLLGDNRAESIDSRFHLAAQGGTVPRSAVTARVAATLWPPGRMGVRQPGGPLRALFAAGAAGAVLILGGAAADPVAAAVRRRRGRTKDEQVADFTSGSS